MLLSFKSLAWASLAVATVSAQSDPPTLLDLLKDTPEVTSLAGAVASLPDLANFLLNATDITILAPTNDAFAKFLKTPGVSLSPNNTDLIEALLAYHVLQQTLPSSEFSETPAFVPTLLDTPYTNVTGGQVVEGALNGSDVVITSGLKATSKVVKADITFVGGVIHLIDSILTIPPKISRTLVALKFTVIAELLQKTGLLTAVDDTKDVTVFVPTNAAFEANAATLAKLSASEVATVLKAHVVAGAVGYSSSLEDGQVLTSLSGGKITITIEDGDVFANGVKVIVPDVLVANGVAHVIEDILPLTPSNATGSSSTTKGSSPTQGGSPPKGVPSATGAGPSKATGSPIVPYSPNAASSIQVGWTGAVALLIGAGIYLNV